ncbi:MAG TPA: sugar kinase [Burkholderiales bacterium]|nr:sugar kinase [Burkholderiales bacterium]
MGAAVDIVSLGEPLYEFSQIRGEDKRYLQGFGGDTMNAAIAAARQGAQAAYITRLGDDEFGRQLLDLWRSEGLDTSGVGLDCEAHTAVYFIHYGPQGHVFSYLRAGSAASRMRPEHLPLDLIRHAKFFHASAISQAISASACDTVFAAIDTAKSAGVKFAYDSNLRLRLWPLPRAKAVITATIPLADYFLPSLDDVKALSGLEQPEAIVDWSHRLGARHVALKLGADGALASDGARQERIAPHQVECVDATGAGDCFAGSLLARLCLGDDFWRAVRYANAAAALATTGYGAVAPLPRPEAVRKLLASQAQR